MRRVSRYALGASPITRRVLSLLSDRMPAADAVRIASVGVDRTAGRPSICVRCQTGETDAIPEAW